MFDRHARTAFILTIIALVVSAMGFRIAVDRFNVYLRKESVPIRSHFDNLPTTLGPWKMVREGEKLSEELVEELGTRIYLNRAYARDGDTAGGDLLLHLTYYTGMIDAVPHVPDRCLVAGGFNIVEMPVNMPLTVDRSSWIPDPDYVNDAIGQPYQQVLIPGKQGTSDQVVRMPLGDIRLRTTRFNHTDDPKRPYFGGYFFIANGRTAATPGAVKRLAFEKGTRYAYYCKVQFFTAGDADATTEDFILNAGDFLQSFLPHLMRCLPDWTEYENPLESAAS